MEFKQYNELSEFGAATLAVLLENEVQNNLIISFINNENNKDTKAWFLGTVKDETGSVVLTAACTPPFNIVLYETANCPNDRALSCLAEEIQQRKLHFPGVLAEQDLAQRAAKLLKGDKNVKQNLSMYIMRLDHLNEVAEVPGRLRYLQETDLYYIPYWEKSFGEECHTEFYDIATHIEKTKERLNKNIHFIWEDQHPVSQAINGRNTNYGAGINYVYTPPNYRNRGYGSRLVAEASQLLLQRGYQFCFLFADTANPISCGIYRKIGYRELCTFSDLRFVE